MIYLCPQCDLELSREEIGKDECSICEQKFDIKKFKRVSVRCYDCTSNLNAFSIPKNEKIITLCEFCPV